MADLGLQTQAELHFGFLVSEKGYTCTESTQYSVRFESSSVFIELVFGGDRSYELGLLVGRKGMEDPPFSIDEILRLRNAPEAEAFSLVQVTTSESLAVWVEKLATVFRAYAEDFVAGSEESFAEVAAQRHKEVQGYALERELRAARAEAEIAWRKKDYAAVVEILTPVRTALTASEVGKLEFAEKQRGR